MTGTIPSGGYLVTGTANMNLSNTGDEIMLYDGGASLVDQVAFGTHGGAPIAPTGDSTARAPNGADTDDDAANWTLDQTPTSGAANDAPAVNLGHSLLINEMNNYSPPSSDAMEFYNPLTVSVPITGWLISDGDGWGTIITTAVVPANGWLVINPNDYGVYFTGTDVGYLFRPDGVRVDQIGWDGEYEDDTFQRICDGDGPNDGYDWTSSGGGVTWFDLPDTLGATNTPGPVDMTVTKTGPTSVSPGGLITYVVAYGAVKPMPTTAIVITEQLPADVTLIGYTAAPTLTEMGGDPLWWDAGARCGFPSGRITITVQVSDTVLPGAKLVNTVEITASGEYTPADNTAIFTTTVVGADIAVSKSGSPDPLWPGDTISYTIHYDIRATEPMSNVQITDAFPGDFSYITYTAPLSFTCMPPPSPPGGVLTCTAVSLTVSGDMVVTGTVVSPPSKYVLTNTVAVTATNDGDANNNGATYINHIVVPIHEIQYVPDPVADDASPYVGEYVWIEGIVIAASDIYPSTNNRYFIEDPAGGPWSGLYIYNGGDKPAVQEGDWVLLYGQVLEYNGVTELSIRDSVGGIQQVISNSNPLPAPEVIATGVFTPTGAATAEAYESVLIEFQGAVVTDDNLGYGEWAFDDGSGEAHADDWSQYLTYSPANGDLYGFIRGIGNYSYSNYKLVPRYDADIDLDYPVTFMYHDLEQVVPDGLTLHVAGNFNGWSTTATPMVGDGASDVYTATTVLDTVPYTLEYKYVAGDSWSDGQGDILNTDNRQASVTASTTLHDYRNIRSGYARLNGPATIVVNLGDPTPVITGETWFSNLPFGPNQALVAEMGYGADADLDAWTWATATFTGRIGNNDAFSSVFTPTTPGVYSFTIRFDGNWAAGNPHSAWYPGDLDGVHPGDPFEWANTGVLTVTAPNLAVTKSVTPSADLLPGGSVTFTIALSNNGDGAATGVVLTDALPSGLSFGGWVQQSSAVQANNVITWTGDLAAGGQATIIFTTTLDNDPALYGQVITNTATFASANAGSGFAEASLSVSGAPALTIAKAVTPTADLPLGGIVTYTLTLSNSGDSAATGVVLTDALPSGVSFGGWVQQGGAVQANNVITWAGDVAAGAQATIIFTASVSSDPAYAGQTITNTVAFVSANGGNGSAEATFAVIPIYYNYLPLILKNGGQ